MRSFLFGDVFVALDNLVCVSFLPNNKRNPWNKSEPSLSENHIMQHYGNAKTMLVTVGTVKTMIIFILFETRFK